MSNIKRYSLIVLIAMLIFILIPVSFANDLDDNATEMGVNEDSDILSEVDESHFIVENTNYVIDEDEDVDIYGTVYLFDGVNYPDPINVRYEYDDASGVRQSGVVQYHEDFRDDSFSIKIKNLTYKESPYVITISAVEDDLYYDYLGYGDPLQPVDIYVTVESPLDPQQAIPSYETFTPKGQIYVDSQNGNDTFNGTQEAPFLTIQRALDENKLLGGNYEIIVMEGNYTFDEYYTIRNNVSINGRGKVKITNDGAYYIFFLQGPITVEFKNLIMTEGQSGAISGAATVNGLGEYLNENKVLNIVNCTFKDNVGGLGWDHVAVGVVKSYSKTTIINSTFIDNEGLGTQDDFKGIINLPDGSLTISYCNFINNKVRDGTPLIYTAKRSYANYNFWGTNDGPKSSDISENVKVKTWIGYFAEIEEGEKLAGDEYAVNVVAKYANSTKAFKPLEISVPDISLDLKSKLNGTSENIIVSNNVASINYVPSKVGEERLGIYMNDFELSYLEFYVHPAITDRIYVSPNGNDSNTGSYKNPFKTIGFALAKNAELGGDKTIYLLNGTYVENGLQINAKVNIIGENATVNGDGNQIFIIGNDTQIKSLKFINGIGICHNCGTLDIMDSTFEGNDIAILSKYHFNVANSTFIRNGEAISADLCSIDECIFENNTEAVNVLKSTNISNSRFIDNDVAIKINQSGIVENNIFTLNTKSIIVTDSISTSIIGNEFNQDNSPITSFNSALKVFDNEFNGNVNYALDINSSSADLKNNALNGLKSINIFNSTVANAIITFLENKSVKVKNGTIQLNATVTDDMGNVINGGRLFFGTTPADIINGSAHVFKEYDTGDYIISGDSDNFPDATVRDGLLRVNVPNYWFIGEKGYETLAEAIDDAEVDDVIKGIPGVYEYDTIQIGHRITPSEPWVINKQITVTSLNDEPITLKALGKNIFNLDYYSNITVKNIIFMNAYNPDGWGGAIHSMGKNTNIIENCTFMDNYAEDGAAIHAWGNLYIKDTLFINNVAEVYAGAIFKDGDGDFIIENCKFINNSAFTYAGAVYTMGYSDTYQIFKNVTFDGNDATCGGALFTAGKNVTFIDCNFTNNKAVDKNSGYNPLGGAIYVHHGATKFVNVNIVNNTAEGNGGALELDNGALSMVNGSGRHVEIYWAILENCLIENNTAGGFGGAIYTNELRTHVNITNSIIRNNTAKNALIVNIYGFYTLDNVIVEDNKLTAGDLLTYSYGAFSIPEPFYSNMTILNSTFRNNGNNIVAVAFSEYVTVNISDSTFDGNGPILESSNSTAYLANNIELNPLGNYSIDNNGNLSLKNNTFANVIYSTGFIETPTFVVVVGNETRFETVGNVIIDAVVVDDNNNIIAGGNLTFLVNDVLIPATFENNMFVANYTVVASSQTINASYDDRGLLKLSTKPGEIIGRVIPQISADDVEFNITGEFKVSLTYEGKTIANEDIVLTVNNVNYTEKTDSNGIATFNLELPYGSHVGKFRFNGNNEYAPISGNATIAVNKYSSKIDLSVKDIEIYEDAVISISLPKGATGNVLVDVSGRIYSPVVNNSAASVTISNLGMGTYDVYVEYHGDERFLNSTATGTFKVSKKQTTYSIVNDGKNINIALPDDASGIVTVKVSNKENNYTLVNGKFSLNIDSLPKQGNIEISYSGDGKYAPFNLTRSISSLKSDIVITAVSKFTRTAVDYSAGERGGFFYATLKDTNGNALVGKTVKFTLNGKVYTGKTDKQGKAGIRIDLANAGTYKYKISFEGDGKYNSAPVVSSKLTLKAKKITIKAKAKKFKAKTKVKKYTITLKTTKNQFNGKTYLKKGKKVTLKIKGKKYTAKTNAKGKATFKIKKFTKKGKYSAKITFKGDKTYKSASKKVKITIK